MEKWTRLLKKIKTTKNEDETYEAQNGGETYEADCAKWPKVDE